MTDTPSARPAVAQTKKRGRGRPGGLGLARDFLVLISSLDDAGDAVTIEAVTARLGIPVETARFLVEDLLGLNVIEGGYLPLVEDGDGVSLTSARGVRGRPLRLSRSETYAILTALDRLGIGEDDPLRQAIQTSFASAGIDAVEIERLLAPVGTPTAATTLSTCVRAAMARHEIEFDYRGGRDSEPRRRVVDPLSVHQADNTWYIDAIDVSLAAERTFRVDRMGKAVDTGRPFSATSALPHAQAHSTPRPIRVTFHDRRYLDLLEWPGIETVSDDGNDVVATIDYLGGDWLPRHLMACAGTVDIADAAVRGRMDKLAQEALEEREA